MLIMMIMMMVMDTGLAKEKEDRLLAVEAAKVEQTKTMQAQQVERYYWQLWLLLLSSFYYCYYPTITTFNILQLLLLSYCYYYNPDITTAAAAMAVTITTTNMTTLTQTINTIYNTPREATEQTIRLVCQYDMGVQM